MLYTVLAAAVAAAHGFADQVRRPALAGDFQGNVVCIAKWVRANSIDVQVAGRRRGEIDANGRVQRTQTYPKSKRRVPQSLPDGEVLVLGIVALWRASPYFFVDESDDPGKSWFDSAVRLWESGLDNSVKASTMTNAIMTCQPVLQAASAGMLGGPLNERLLRFLKYSV